jgi:cytochrome c553
MRPISPSIRACWLGLLLLAAVDPLRAQADVGRGSAVYTEICMRCHDSDPMRDRPGTAAHRDQGVRTAISVIPQMRWLEQRLSAQQVDDVQAWLDYVVLPAGAVRPQTGWYWDPQRPGRGFFFEYGQGQASLASFFFTDSGRPDWALSVQRYDGSAAVLETSLLQFSDGQALLQPWRPAQVRSQPQPAELELVDSTRLRLHLGSTVLPLQRVAFDFGPVPLPPRPGLPQSGWWWDRQASGSGYSLEFQGNQLLLALYAYEPDGHAAWWLAVGAMQSENRFEGELQRYTDGQTLLSEFRPNRIDAGFSLRVHIEFETPRTARIRIGDAPERSIRRFF